MDITRDVMKMVGEGRRVEEMREVIIERYGKLGPSTGFLPSPPDHRGRGPSVASAGRCRGKGAACCQPSSPA